jgi:hypothetical protein
VRIDSTGHATRGVLVLSDFRDRERRASPRTRTAFVVTIRGVDAHGRALDVDTMLDNLSGSGLYVRIPRRVERGEVVAVGIRFAEAGTLDRVARVAARGVVVRVDPTPDGAFGLAIAFTKTRVF